MSWNFSCQLYLSKAEKKKRLFSLSVTPALPESKASHVSPTQNSLRETGARSRRKHELQSVQIHQPLLSCCPVLNITEITLSSNPERNILELLLLIFLEKLQIFYSQPN